MTFLEMDIEQRAMWKSLVVEALLAYRMHAPTAPQSQRASRMRRVLKYGFVRTTAADRVQANVELVDGQIKLKAMTNDTFLHLLEVLTRPGP